MMNRKIQSEKIGKYLFLLCWAAYFTSYLGRLNFSSAMSSIIEDGVLSFSQAGTVSMIYFFAYGIGQLCNGILGDKWKPQIMVFVGLLCSGMANFLMGAVHSFPFMAILWGINGYMQSMIWPPIIRIFAEKYSDEKKLKYSVDIVSSMAAGTLMSYFLSACAMHFFHWKAAFYLAAGILIVVSLVWIAGYGGVETAVRKQEGRLPGEAVSQKDPKVTDAEPAEQETAVLGSRKPFLPLLLGSGLIGILFPVMIHGILKDGVTQWVPTYIYDSFDVSASFSVIVTMILPLINLSGAYLARFFAGKHPAQEVRTSLYFFGAAMTALLGLLIWGTCAAVLSALLFAVITASMMAVNTLYVNMIPLHFEKEGRVSTVSGFLNSVAYLGSAISTFTIGVLVERAGWSVTILSWVVITAAAFLVCFGLRKRVFTGSGKQAERTQPEWNSIR